MRPIDADALQAKILGLTITENTLQYANAVSMIIADAPTIDAAPQWISVKERLPSDDNEDWVLAIITENNGYKWMPTRGEYRKALDDWYFEETGWLRNHNGYFHVTHWMPLPKSPLEEEDVDIF